MAAPAATEPVISTQMAVPPTAQPAVSPPGVPYAGIATRAVALAIDVLIANAILFSCGAILTLVASLVSDAKLDSSLEKFLAGAAWLTVVGFYFVVFWTTAGQTPGMRVMALRVMTPAGARPGLPRSIVRLVGLGLAIIPLFAGFLPVLVDSRRRALQDFLAGTVVVYAGREPPPEPEPVAAPVVGDIQPSG
jgi:uncharacterized RDD family membrane protein YckC